MVDGDGRGLGLGGAADSCFGCDVVGLTATGGGRSSRLIFLPERALFST